MILGLIPPIEQLKSLMQWLLQQIHTTTGLSWAWSIIVLTVIVRLALVPLTVKQQQSMRQMQALQPEIKALQEKHKGDRAALQQATMEFYRERKVNPFGSCLPLVAQIPIFMGLYYGLRDESFYDDGTSLSFISYDFIPRITMHLNDLSDEGYTSTLVVLMVLYVGSQVLSTLLVPSSVDKVQRYLFLAMPLIFAIFIVNQAFPVGLMIYWITSNFWTVGQALVIRQFFPPPLIAQRKAEAEARELALQKKEERKAAGRARKEAAAERPAIEKPKPEQPQKPVRRPRKPPRARPGQAPDGDAVDGPAEQSDPSGGTP